MKRLPWNAKDKQCENDNLNEKGEQQTLNTKEAGDPEIVEAEMRQKIQGKEFTKEPQNQPLYCVLCKNIGSAFSTDALHSFHFVPLHSFSPYLNRRDSALLYFIF